MQAQDQRPNVILLLVDDLGWSDIGCNGNVYYETPQIDSLAKQSIFFTNASVSSPFPQQVRQSLLSGQYPVHLTENKMPIIGMPESFKRNGYRTWHVGKSMQKDNPTEFEMFKGFDAIVPSADLNITDPRALVKKVDMLLSESENAPFFLNIWFESSRRYKMISEKKVSYFREKALYTRWMEDVTRKGWCTGYYDELPVHKGYEHLKMPDEAKYAAYLSQLDLEIGRLVKMLKSRSIYNNTILVLTSDGGGNCEDRFDDCNSPLRGSLGSVFEGGVRVPLFIHVPFSIRFGHRCNQHVILEDVYPTLLDICGLPLLPEQHKDGLSLSDVLNYKCEVKRESVFWHFTIPDNNEIVSVIRCCDWKLIYNHTHRETALYHLGKDISESVNLASKFPLKRACMHRKLNAWLESVNKKALVIQDKSVTSGECED